MKRLATLLVASGICLGFHTARADVKLPAVFSDHMVLQQGVAVPVWGWADAGEEIAVSIAGQTATAKAGKDGRWIVRLGKLETAGTPQTLTVRGKTSLTINDVLVGEVWLASGQSNMALTVDRAQDFDKEKAAANFPQLRMFTVSRNPQRTPQADCAGAWQVCTPDTVAKFSAVAYFFGRKLHQELGVPVGLVHSSVGGTDIAAWTSEEAQSKIPDLKALMNEWANRAASYDAATAKATYEKQLAAWNQRVRKAKAEKKELPRRPRSPEEPARSTNHPANLYNGMIAPLIPYAIRGAIWYQGEHNTASNEIALRYRAQLPLLVEDWRARWGYDFPFAWVQLPNFDGPGDGRPLVREAMLLSLKVKDTGMAVTVDIGEAKNNHPTNKQEVGRRLSLWAFGAVYGRKVPAVSGPLPAGHKVQGSEVVISFQHTEGGLVAEGGRLKGFAIAGEDRQFKEASARIEGDKVTVSSPGVAHPVAVRYAWAWNPEASLYNGAGLPASPFRTDDWQ